MARHPLDGGRQAVVLGLQRAAGNRAVSAMLTVQRSCGCGGSCPACRWEAVQREGPATGAGGPDDLSGTPFAALDPALKAKLAEPGVFDRGGKATLAAALNDLPNVALAALARVGSMISATAPFLWAYVKRIRGGWATDNFGIGVEWSSGSALAAVLAADPGWCRDNPATARWYHGSTDSFRQIPSRPGAASLHVITAGSTDVHIDLHQPIEGKETSWPWKGQCDLNWSAWVSHAGDVEGGGGARGTTVGRYGEAWGGINRLRAAPECTDEQRKRLDTAAEHLSAITDKVQKYAALGAMVGDEWEGDRQMAADAATMSSLRQAEAIVREVGAEQAVTRMERSPSRSRHR